MEEKKDQQFKPLRELANYGALGLNLVMLMLGGYFIGSAMDKRFHTSPRWMLIGACAGMLLGLYTVFEVAFRLGKKNARK